jgi:hypothetical protein
LFGFDINDQTIADSGTFSVGLDITAETDKSIVLLSVFVLSGSAKFRVSTIFNSSNSGGSDISSTIYTTNTITNKTSPLVLTSGTTATGGSVLADRIVRGVAGQGNNDGLSQASYSGALILDGSVTSAISIENLGGSSTEFDLHALYAVINNSVLG